MLSVNGAVGDAGIASMWQHYFDCTYSAVNSSHDQAVCLNRLATSANGVDLNVSMYDIIDMLLKRQRGKAVGPDGIAAEAFLYDPPWLFTHLSILFFVVSQNWILTEEIFGINNCTTD